MLDWMKDKLESRLPGEADDTTFLAESEEELKSLLMKVKEENDKAGFSSVQFSHSVVSDSVTP